MGQKCCACVTRCVLRAVLGRGEGQGCVCREWRLGKLHVLGGERDCGGELFVWVGERGGFISFGLWKGIK